MNRILTILTALIAGFGSGAFAAPPPVPETPAGVSAILYARPFRLLEGFEYQWRKERFNVREGVLLVVEADPALVYPRQALEPVLYVGNQTAMRLNVGYPSGRVVALVPGQDALGPGTPIWFGTPALPASVSSQTIADERRLAAERGVAPPSSGTVSAALRAGGAALTKRDLNALLADAANLVRRYAPDEKDLAATLSTQAQ